tara:strand:+ start:697 stop:1152 length:456 start_codon:yes stop_codon:yes gene_type:complete
MLKYKLSQIKKFSKKILSNLSQSDCIYLFGELGSGKTTFTRCLIHLLQEKNKVKKCEVLSPTYTLLQEYEIKSTTVMHYDLYRINNEKDIEQLGIFEKTDNVIKIIEWPERIIKKINNRLEITFLHVSNPEVREVKIKGFGRWKEFKINEI